VTRLDSAYDSARGIATAPPGHPARGRVCCRGRSPGSRVNAAVRPSRNRLRSQWLLLDSGSPLTVAGAAPALASYGRTGFPLSFGPTSPKNHDGFS